MRPLGATLLPILFVAAALAGCTGGNDCVDFCVEPTDDGGRTFAFSAAVAADNYTWDFGDNGPRGYGKDVEHTYDVQDGTVTPRLYARSGAETLTFAKKDAVVLGTGKNERATFLMEAQTNWAVTGERIRFSADQSSDPDGDTLRFAWACTFDGPLPAPSYHTHNNPVAPFESPSAGSVTSGLANRTLPEPALSIDPSLDGCAELGTIGEQDLSPNAKTLELSFTTPGKYSIFLVAADPVHPAASGAIILFVTSPADRPPPLVHQTFTETLTAGAPANLPVQEACDQVKPGQVCNQMRHQFEIGLGAKIGWLNLTYETTQAQESITCQLKRGNDAVTTQTGNGSSVVGGHLLPAAAYNIICTLTQGANVPYTVTFDAHLNVDPLTLYN